MSYIRVPWTDPPPWQPYPQFYPPYTPPSITWPGTATAGEFKTFDLRKREKQLEELLRMAVDELMTGDEDAWALAELIEETLGVST